ncbi:hypothetical protein WMF04_17440 [Sorangium sp. So ce260]|uniref:hypothetical protein n=1 Tax=Sorangium sp. So ce260 TaxID=3133291 RepID=UPI003F5FAC3C
MRYHFIASSILLSLLGCGIAVEPGDSGPGSASSGASSASGGPSSCSPSDPCPAGAWCKYEDERCERDAGATGTCVSEECEDGIPYCGCDGNVYPSSCAAHLAGTYVTDAALCSEGTFACGDKSCKEHIEYCSRQILVVGGYTFECRTPSATASSCEGGVVSCECLTGYPPGESPPGGDSCNVDARGQVTYSWEEI